MSDPYDYRDDYPKPTEDDIAAIAPMLGGDVSRARQIAEAFPASLGIEHYPGSRKDRQRRKLLDDLLAPEACVTHHYDTKILGFFAACHAFSRFPELERIAEAAVTADRRSHDGDRGGPLIIFTSRPGERLALDGDVAFRRALAVVDGDVACDLATTPSCVKLMQMAKRHKLTTTPSGEMLNRPFTFPMAYEDYVVMSRICIECWIEFVKRYKIKDARIQNPWETLR